MRFFLLKFLRNSLKYFLNHTIFSVSYTHLYLQAFLPFLHVAQAYCYGMVSGTGDNTFTPDRLVTREEMAKMLVSTLTASEVNFNLSDGYDDADVVNAFEDSDEVSSWACLLYTSRCV